MCVKSVPKLPARFVTVYFPYCLAMFRAGLADEAILCLWSCPQTLLTRVELDARMENLEEKLLANVAFKGKEGEMIRAGDRPVSWKVLCVVNNGSY